MKVSVKVASTIAAAVVMTAGIAGVVGASADTSVQNTGKKSNNEVNVSDTSTATHNSANTVGVENNNPQTSTSGDATVTKNKKGGDATSGAAATDSKLKVTGNFSNGSTGGNGGSAAAGDTKVVIDGTGKKSNNEVNVDNKSTTTVNKANNIAVTNNNTQNATSGNATVTNNKKGGSATSGNATTASDTTVDLTASN